MKHTSQLGLTAILLFASATHALQRSSQMHLRKRSDVTPGWAELQRSITKMHMAMATVKPSGDSDRDFVELMLPHHQAAIDMAKSELLHGKDPQTLRLAQEIVTDQQSEIELMQLWLKKHGQKSTELR
jgi:uncharacterized protein (DUF305 family)